MSFLSLIELDLSRPRKVHFDLGLTSKVHMIPNYHSTETNNEVLEIHLSYTCKCTSLTEASFGQSLSESVFLFNKFKHLGGLGEICCCSGDLWNSKKFMLPFLLSQSFTFALQAAFPLLLNKSI